MFNSNVKLDLDLKLCQNFELLETMLYYKGNIFLKHYHIQRIYFSIKNLKFTQYSYKDICNIFLKLECDLYIKFNKKNNKYCIRFLINENGVINYSVKLLSEIPLNAIKNNKIQLVIANECTNYDNNCNYEFNKFWLHKTSIRSHYDKLYINTKLKYNNINFSDIVLYNKYGYITESSKANIAILNKNNLFVTPPIKHGLLAGTMRQYLLYSKHLICKDITIDDIKNAKYILWFNSLRGIYLAQLNL